MHDPVTFLITFVLRVAALVFLLRFILQAVRASFYNPLSEAIVRLTDRCCGRYAWDCVPTRT